MRCLSTNHMGGTVIHWRRGITALGWLITLGLLTTACAGAYGSLQRSKAVSQAFERNEVLTDHHYYTAGSESRPTAILAVHRAYTLKPGLWRPVAMTGDQLARLVDAMTDQLGFTPAIMGSVIMDPQGKQAGVWYSLYSRTTIRFEPGNLMAVSLPSSADEPLRRDPNSRRRP